MKISDAGIALIKSVEGLRLEAYPDPATGGDPWTVGYGHTGPEVKPGLVISEAEAEALLRADCTWFEECVDAYVIVDLEQNQFDALVSFAFNVGCRALESSTLLKLVNAGNFEAAEGQFSRWNKAGGKVLSGLSARRKQEAELFKSQLA